MISESGGRAVVIAPSALGSKDLPVGLSKVPPRESARRYIRRRASVGGMWRRRIRGEVPDMTISRVQHGFQNRSLEDGRGFDIFPRRVGPGTWYLHILSSICRAFMYTCIYVRLVMPSYLLFCYIYFNGVSHAVQNEKKLWKFTQSDRWGNGARSTGGDV